MKPPMIEGIPPRIDLGKNMASTMALFLLLLFSLAGAVSYAGIWFFGGPIARCAITNFSEDDFLRCYNGASLVTTKQEPDEP